MAGGISWLFREDALGKAESGAFALVPGVPAQSEMLKRIVDRDDPMPPPEHGPMLSPQEVSLLTRWVEQGAVWEDHWAFVKPVRPPVPAVKEKTWPAGPLDSFVLARLEAEHLHPEPEQPRARLLRRVALDLTGLPPTPDEIDAFVRNPAPDAYETEVDRLLALPAFGERWAAMWLDAVRYADSKGLGQDQNREMWKYRDWVIDAFNEDLPYDRFTIKQLAGDLLPAPSLEDRIATACHRATATNDEGGTDDEEFRIEALIDRVSTTWQTWQGVTFGCVQCHSHPYDPIRHEEFYSFAAILNQTRDVDTEADYPFVMVPVANEDYAEAGALDKQIKALRRKLHAPSEALASRDGIWQGLQKDLKVTATGCGAIVVRGTARYQLTGTVPGGTRVTVEAPVPAGMTQLTALRLDAWPVDAEKARTVSEIGFVLDSITLEIVPADGGKPEAVTFARVFGDEVDPFLDPEGSITPGKDKGFAAFTRMNGPRHAVFVPEQAVVLPAGASLRAVLAFDTTIQASFPLVIRHGSLCVSGDPSWTGLVADAYQREDRTELAALVKSRKAIKSVKLPVMEALDSPFQRSMQVFVRGNWLTRGNEVVPGVPRAFPPLPSDRPPDRLALARWLMSPDHPLTARVMVNRLWEQIFGTGLVETMEDFGSAGERPSHPGLLDWLAVHFREDLHWSMKSLIRTLVVSSAYRQDNRIDPDKLDADPANRLLARGPRLRLTAEMLRDQALSAAGLLNPALHGPPAHPPIPEGVWNPFVGGEKWPVPGPGDPARYRRALYTQAKRSIPYPGSAVFDAPSREICSQRRIQSNTPVQALTLMNDEVFTEAAAALARRMEADAPEIPDRLRAGYRILTGRVPDPFILKRLERLYADSLAGTGNQPAAALENTAIVLLNLDEVLTR